MTVEVGLTADDLMMLVENIVKGWREGNITPSKAVGRIRRLLTGTEELEETPEVEEEEEESF